MSRVLVDSNVLLDVITEDEEWFPWSSAALATHAESNVLAINLVIYAEVSVGFAHIEDFEEALRPAALERMPIPWEAAFLAGKCFLRYRKNGGSRRSPLPDFFIGAHAAVAGMPLITRDARRYRTYFPALKVIAPA